MGAPDAWAAVLAAGLVTQLLRFLPVFLVRCRGERPPGAPSRVLENAGLATVGGLIAVAVFRNGGDPSALQVRDPALKMVSLAVSFLFYVKFRKGPFALALGYASYVLLVLFTPA
jgi:branched-subunit amino acid transport protein